MPFCCLQSINIYPGRTPQCLSGLSLEIYFFIHSKFHFFQPTSYMFCTQSPAHVTMAIPKDPIFLSYIFYRGTNGSLQTGSGELGGQCG